MWRPAIIALLALSACAGTHLQVDVESPTGRPQAGVHVNLLFPHEPCEMGGPVTDARGRVGFTREYCGPLRVAVAAPGYETLRQTLDTCDRHYLTVRLREAAPPPPPPSDPCAKKAEEFLRAWLVRDLDAMLRDLVDAEAAPRVMREEDAVPWRVAIESGRVVGAECSVAARLYYDEGCVETWRVDLLQVDGAWRVLGIQRGTYE